MLLSILIILFAAFNIYLIIRNSRVERFMINWTKVIFGALKDYNDNYNPSDEELTELLKYVEDLLHKNRYEDILFSFKPLKLRYWYTEEEMSELAHRLKLDENKK